MMELGKDGKQGEDSTSRPACDVAGGKDASDLGRLEVPTNRFPLTQRIEDWNNQVMREGWEVRLSEGLSERPALQRGYKILQNGGPAIVGMSLENSYFSKETLTRLFRFLESLSCDVYLLVMDKPSEHNYRALSYSEERITQKVKKKGAEMFRAIDDAMEAIGQAAKRFHILDWTAIRTHGEYQLAKRSLESLYVSNKTFRNDVRAAVKAYIAPRLHGEEVTEDRHANADQYLLEELAFLICSQKLLDTGAPAYLYHKAWSIFERLVTGAYDQNSCSSMGFVELEVQTDPG